MNKNHLKIMALALALPSSLIGIFGLVYTLVRENIISEGVALIVILVFIIQIFYLMMRYVFSRKNKP